MKKQTPVVIIPAEVYARMAKVVREIGQAIVYYPNSYDSTHTNLMLRAPETAEQVWKEAFALLDEIGRDDE